MKVNINLVRDALRPLVFRRRLHAYCVGTPHSGTSSIAALLRPKYRSEHEPYPREFFAMLRTARNEQFTANQMRHLVRWRDRRLYLEMDSSGLNVYLLDYLISEFPRARFILTMRDCYSYLQSAINHRITRRRPSNWQDLQEFRFGARTFKYSLEEDVLKQHRLPTFDAYLSNWGEHNQYVIQKVPQDRLFILRTHEISNKSDELADFLHIPRAHICQSQGHQNAARTKAWSIQSINQDYLREKVQQHCQPLMDKYFPELAPV